MKNAEVLHDLLQFFFALLGRSDWSSPIALDTGVDTGDGPAPVPMVPGTLMQLPGNFYGPACAAHYEVSESAAGRHEGLEPSTEVQLLLFLLLFDLSVGHTWTPTSYRAHSGGECQKECRNRIQA